MTFKEFAGYLEEMEEVSSRLVITEMLAKVLSKFSVNESRIGTYLMLGQLAPEFRSIEFNMAEKMVVRAIARATGQEVEMVTSQYKQMGDLGKVIKEMGIGGDTGLDLETVYEKLISIAEDDGDGSQERKIESLARLLQDLDSGSGKFVARMVITKLRLGFSYKTIIDAISVMHTGDKGAKRALEKAYQVLPDIGLLAANVKEKGLLVATGNIVPVLGIPVNMMLCQRLKSPREMIAKMGEVAIEPKFDGTRVEIHYRRGEPGMIRSYTRNLKETSWCFPELEDMGRWVKANELILDCEAVGLDEERKAMADFQTTMRRRRKYEIGNFVSKVPIRFYTFDILYMDGLSLMGRPYLERRKILSEVVSSGNLFEVDEYRITKNPDDITAYHRAMLDEGLEGVIVKQIKSEYIPGRTAWRWVKMKEEEDSLAKLTDTVDCVVMGYSVGQGKRTDFGIGKFLVGVRDGDVIKTVTKVGTGLTDEQFRELKVRLDKYKVKDRPKGYVVEESLTPDVWVDPMVVVEIGADEITKSPKHTAGVALRFPRLIRFRDDKNIDGVTTVEELKQIRKS